MLGASERLVDFYPLTNVFPSVSIACSALPRGFTKVCCLQLDSFVKEHAFGFIFGSCHETPGQMVIVCAFFCIHCLLRLWQSMRCQVIRVVVVPDIAFDHVTGFCNSIKTSRAHAFCCTRDLPTRLGRLATVSPTVRGSCGVVGHVA